ncbi:MAG: hypothetical protein V1704_01720 [Candidatus Vogelbacteria bacterium]
MSRKVILIIFLIVLAVGTVSYFAFVKNSVPYASQAECEQKTGKQCYLFRGLCQVGEARNQSESEANEKFLRDCLLKIGTWQPTVAAFQTTSSPETGVDNWKTYQNEQYGFEMKYPNDWIISDHSSGLLVLKSTQERIGDIQSFFAINIKKNYKINSETGAVMEKINIGGRLGYKYFYQEGAGTSEVVLIHLGQDALELSLDYFASNSSNFNDRKIAIQRIIDPIISTFKFTQ